MKIKYFLGCAIAAICFCLITPTFAFADDLDAHFFLRYDSTVQEEDGTTHYSPNNYFPIGEVADGYVYGKSKSDYTSVDGQVTARTAYVGGAETLITAGNINLYNTFGVDKTTILPFFDNVYSKISVLPSDEILASSIGKALGEEWQQAYEDGKIGIVWYVVKDYNPYINVDGCLYWLKSGESVDKGDVDENGHPVDPIEPDPVDPIEPDPVDPIELDQPKEEVIEDNPTPLAKSPVLQEFPRTDDDYASFGIHLSFFTILILTTLILAYKKRKLD